MRSIEERLADAQADLNKAEADIIEHKRTIRQAQELVDVGREILATLLRQRADLEDALYRIGHPAGTYGQYPPDPGCVG